MSQFTQYSLWLIFKLDNAEYCILSDYIESIHIPGKIEPIPCSEETLVGVARFASSILSVIDLRTVFGKMNLANYTEQFAMMKDMHISWIQDLQRFVNEGGEFNKPVDPHKCKFGIWFDNFHTENYSLKHILRKLSKPHERIHHCGAEIKELVATGEYTDEQLQEILEEAAHICYKEVVPLLDRLIEIYRDVNRGILIVVNSGAKQVGLLVDEVTTLVSCNKTKQQDLPTDLKSNIYLKGLVVKEESMMLEINVDKIVSCL